MAKVWSVKSGEEAVYLTRNEGGTDIHKDIQRQPNRCPFLLPGDLLQCQRDNHPISEPHKAQRRANSVMDPLGRVEWYEDWLPNQESEPLLSLVPGFYEVDQ